MALLTMGKLSGEFGVIRPLPSELLKTFRDVRSSAEIRLVWHYCFAMSSSHGEERGLH